MLWLSFFDCFHPNCTGTVRKNAVKKFRGLRSRDSYLGYVESDALFRFAERNIDVQLGGPQNFPTTRL